jgi:hypothetical protein
LLEALKQKGQSFIDSGQAHKQSEGCLCPGNGGLCLGVTAEGGHIKKKYQEHTI